MVEDKTKDKEDGIKVVQVATQTANMFQLPNGDVVNHDEYLVWIGNNITKIVRAVV